MKAFKCIPKIILRGSMIGIGVLMLSIVNNIELNSRGVIEMSEVKIEWETQMRLIQEKQIKHNNSGLNSKRKIMDLNTRRNPKRLESNKSTLNKSVNKSQDSHVNKTDLQVARRTENQILKLSSPRKPLLKQDDKDSVQKRNKSKVFYLI
jgi:hypothetical protein